ncbi:hypothetical protein LINGRAHAP2_LOCUS30621, partial [Linum grandiflorum]
GWVRVSSIQAVKPATTTTDTDTFFFNGLFALPHRQLPVIHSFYVRQLKHLTWPSGLQIAMPPKRVTRTNPEGSDEHEESHRQRYKEGAER